MIGLTPSQARVLGIIREAGRPLLYREIAERAGLSSRAGAHNRVRHLLERGHVVATDAGIAPAGFTFIPIGTRPDGPGRPTAAKDHYPFLGHRTCAEWGGRSLHGEAA